VTASHSLATNAHISVQLGNGDGTFRPGTDVSLENSDTVIQAPPFILGDVYGNGKLDVVTFTNFLPNNVGLSILPGNGDGTFGTAQNLVVNFPGVDAAFPVAVGDLNGDGHPDLVVFTETSSFPSVNRILVLYGQADGSFVSNPTAPFLTRLGSFTQIGTFAQIGSYTLADVNRDGIPDLVFLDILADGTSVASVVLGDKQLANAGFTPTRLDFPLAAAFDVHAPQLLQVADVDGDGRLDLVVEEMLTPNHEATSGFEITVLRGNGDGTFGTAIESAFPLNAPSGPSAFAMGDVDGDGVVDAVLARDGTNSVLLLRGKGDGTFGSLEEFAVAVRPDALRLGDLNNDGALDFVTANVGWNSATFPSVSPRLNRRP
jgi:hypothetical protein